MAAAMLPTRQHYRGRLVGVSGEATRAARVAWLVIRDRSQTASARSLLLNAAIMRRAISVPIVSPPFLPLVGVVSLLLGASCMDGDDLSRQPHRPSGVA